MESVSNTSNEFAGVAIARRCVAVMRGTNTPLELDTISNADEGSGVVVPMPTLFCADAFAVSRIEAIATQHTLESVRTVWFIRG